MLLEKNLEVVDHEKTHITNLPDLAAVQKLDVTCACREIVAKTNAVVVSLDLTFLSPKANAHRVA